MGWMLKVVIFVAAVFAVITWWRSFSMRKMQGDLPRPARKPAQPAQRIVSCQYCGVYIPENSAVHGRSGVYCSDQHRLQDEREHDVHR